MSLRRKSSHPIDELVRAGQRSVANGEAEPNVEPWVEAEHGGRGAATLRHPSTVALTLQLPRGQGEPPTVEQIVLRDTESRVALHVPLEIFLAVTPHDDLDGHVQSLATLRIDDPAGALALLGADVGREHALVRVVHGQVPRDMDATPPTADPTPQRVASPRERVEMIIPFGRWGFRRRKLAGQ